MMCGDHLSWCWTKDFLCLNPETTNPNQLAFSFNVFSAVLPIEAHLQSENWFWAILCSCVLINTAPLCAKTMLHFRANLMLNDVPIVLIGNPKS